MGFLDTRTWDGHNGGSAVTSQLTQCDQTTAATGARQNAHGVAIVK